MTPAARVAAGARLLDRVAPGWATAVTEPVDLRSSTRCPLGQTFGHWNHAIPQVGLWTHAELWAHGFHPTIPGTTSTRGNAALERAWEQEIATRRLRARRAA